MTIQSVPAFPWPLHNLWRSGATAYTLATTTVTIDASTDRIALVFQAPKTGSLDRMEFRVAGGTALQDIRCGWQDVDLTTGDPDGAYDEYADVSSYSAGWIVPSYFGASFRFQAARLVVLTAGVPIDTLAARGLKKGGISAAGQRFPHAFRATMRNGKELIMERRLIGGQRVKRLPIDRVKIPLEPQATNIFRQEVDRVTTTVMLRLFENDFRFRLERGR